MCQCNELTLRIGVPEIDAMRGKEPVVCGFCLWKYPSPLPNKCAEAQRAMPAGSSQEAKF